MILYKLNLQYFYKNQNKKFIFKNNALKQPYFYKFFSSDKTSNKVRLNTLNLLINLVIFSKYRYSNICI